MASRAVASTWVSRSVASTSKAASPIVSVRHMAMVYGSSPVEQPALHTR